MFDGLKLNVARAPQDRAPAMPPPRHLTRFCLSVGNGANGIYANFHPNGLDFINNTAYRNQEDYNMVCIITNTSRSYEILGTNHYMRNNIGFSYSGTNRVVWLNTNWCDVAFNYFTLPVTGDVERFCNVG